MKLYDIDKALMEAFEKAIDPDTGEIYEKPRGGPIDLRKASGN